MYDKNFWEWWWSKPSVSYFNSTYNLINTAQFDIINGEAVERKDYKIKKLKEEKEGLQGYIKHCEKAIIDYSKRIEEIDKELED